MKQLVIYHDSCTDGFGAALAAWLKLGDEAEYLPMNYGKDFSKSENTFKFKGRDIYILDFSFPRDIMEMLFDGAKRVVWLDHHKTAFEMWCKTERTFFEEGGVMDDDSRSYFIKLDNNKSGAYLAWEYFHPGTEIPMLIQHIDDRDRWQWKLDGSAEIHAALSSYEPLDFWQWNDLLVEDPNCTFLFCDGEAILRAQKQHVERMVKQARKCAIIFDADSSVADGARGLAANASLHQSEVGHELANQSGTYGLVWYVAADNRVRVSLRSNGDYDVSAIARSFSGGGHRNAAGFETDVATLMGWLNA